MAPQGFRHLSGLLGALVGVLFEAAQDDVLQLLPDLRAQGPRRLRDLVGDAVQDRLHLAGEGRVAHEALVQDRPERVDVGAGVERARADLLGGEVGDGADQCPGFRQAGFRDRVREAEVHDADPDGRPFLPRDHDVGRLDVAVHDAARVAVFQGVGDLDADVDDIAQAQGLLPDQAQQGRAADQGHHEEERALVPPEVVDGDDGGVVHLGDDLGFPLEPPLDIGSEVGRRDQFDRDLAVQERVLRPVDDAHAAPAELTDDLVAV